MAENQEKYDEDKLKECESEMRETIEEMPSECFPSTSALINLCN